VLIPIIHIQETPPSAVMGMFRKLISSPSYGGKYALILPSFGNIKNPHVAKLLKKKFYGYMAARNVGTDAGKIYKNIGQIYLKAKRPRL